MFVARSRNDRSQGPDSADVRVRAVLEQGWSLVRCARGASIGAVLGRGYGHYDRCRGPDSVNCLEVPQFRSFRHRQHFLREGALGDIISTLSSFRQSLQCLLRLRSARIGLLWEMASRRCFRMHRSAWFTVAIRPCISLWRHLYEFNIIYVKVNSNPLTCCDRAAPVPTAFSDQFINRARWVRLSGVFAAVCGIFRPPSLRTSRPRESPLWPTVVGCRGLEVAGTPGV